jgi:ATP-binding cassette subfamily B protein
MDRLRRRWILLTLGWQCAPGPLTVQASFAAASVAAGFVLTLATGRVVADAAAIRRGGATSGGDAFLRSLLFLCVLFIVVQLIVPGIQIAGDLLAQRVDGEVQRRVMRSTLGPPGIQHLEDPAMLDQIMLVEGLTGGTTPGAAASYLTHVLSAEARAATLLWLIGTRLSWLIVVGLVVGAGIVRMVSTNAVLRIWNARAGSTQSLRRSRYFRQLGMLPAAAKEVRIFRLVDWLKDRFRDHWGDAVRESWRLRTRSLISMSFAATPLWVVMTFTSFAFLGFGALANGRIDDLAVIAQAITTVLVIPLTMYSGDLPVEEGSAVLPKLLDLEAELDRQQADLRGSRDPGAAPIEEIRFEDVTFRYPSAHADTLRGLDLVIPAGRSLAIVGSNGSGKTTLVKLLARLYDPTGGRILVDGHDLHDVDPGLWQRRIAAIFQDFVKYELSLRDNVAFGAPDAPVRHGAIEEALERAGGAAMLAGLPHGWDTVLAKSYARGADVSGGQWQRIALARALYATTSGAGILVLDEPTANLDPRAEADIFRRFLEITRGLTSIVISHRFSTVRQADLICVLDAGRVLELGSHDELMQRDGTYSHLFRLQAERFTAHDEPSSR